MDLLKFFVLVEYELIPDYLKAFFKDELFDKAVLEQLKMTLRFIGNDPDALVEDPYEIQNFDDDEVIGQLRLMGVIKGKDLINNSYLAEAGGDVRYVKDISEIDGIKGAKMLGSITLLFKKTATEIAFTSMQKWKAFSMENYSKREELFGRDANILEKLWLG